jgi:molybdate transport system ATP-binding protein
MSGLCASVGNAQVLHEIDWQICRGENWAVVGPNGAGKSVLASVLAGDCAHSGEFDYLFESKDDPSKRIASVSFRLHRYFVSQGDGYYQSRWYVGEEEATATAGQVLRAAAREHASAKRLAWVASTMKITRLLDRQCLHLSTGEMRRVLIARALLSNPVLLVLDEPFIGLDIAGRALLRNILHKLMRHGQQIVFMTARPWEIPRGITHRVWLRNGNSVETERVTFKHSPAGPVPATTVLKSSSNAVIDLRNITLMAGQQPLIEDLSWTVQPNEHWAVVGPNGSGKTTLLSMLNGDHPQAFAQDVRLFGKPRADFGLMELKAQIGWASPDIALHYDTMTSAFQFACTGFFETLGLYQGVSRAQQRTAREWIDYFGLAAIARVPFRSLSDGQQKLILLARAMVKPRRLLILDEPCQGLDAWSRQRALRAIDHFCRKGKTTLVIVSHYSDELPACITHRLEFRR